MLELRLEGRRISGTVIVYGESSQPGGFTERFLPGSLKYMPKEVMLNVMHNRDIPIGRYPNTMEIIDTEERMEMRATLPKTTDGDNALALIQSGILSGLSIGFESLEEEWDGDIRIVKAAYLDHIAVVDKPAYKNSSVVTRRRNSGLIPPQTIAAARRRNGYKQSTARICYTVNRNRYCDCRYFCRK